MADLLPMRDRSLRWGCLLLVLAIGAYATYAGAFEPQHFNTSPHGVLYWAVTYILFVAAYLISMRADLVRNRNLLIASLAIQSVTSLLLVWFYPSFIVTCLLVVVAWQIAWIMPLRHAIAVAMFQAVVLAAMKCSNEVSAATFSLLVLVVAIGFQAFAIAAAHLARSEAHAYDELARLNRELRAAQALVSESARMSERLRIARDLHDILGHSLTTLTIHLDVARRLTDGKAAEHVQNARDAASTLLEEVRTAVNRFRVAPVDLRGTLQALADGAVGLQVELKMPAELDALDPPRADAIIRCAQEAITNTLRHAHATLLVIELEQGADGAIHISAHDDGRGGPVAEGDGLTGMRERFTDLGGTLSIASSSGQGLRLRGAIPVCAL
jgi:signal transduction histidine kinase